MSIVKLPDKDEAMITVIMRTPTMMRVTVIVTVIVTKLILIVMRTPTMIKMTVIVTVIVIVTKLILIVIQHFNCIKVCIGPAYDIRDHE